MWDSVLCNWDLEAYLRSLFQLESGYYSLFWLVMPLKCWWTSWPSLPVASVNARKTQDADGCTIVCLKSWASYSTVIYTYHQQLMESVGSNGSLSLAFMMNVTDWQFLSNSHNVIAAHIVMLSSKCCSRNFSAISTTDPAVSTCLAILWLKYFSSVIWQGFCSMIPVQWLWNIHFSRWFESKLMEPWS